MSWTQRRACGLWGVALALATLSAAAQPVTPLPGFELEQLQLNPGAQASLWAATGDVLCRGGARLSLTGHYAHDALVYNSGGVRLGALVGRRVTAHLAGAWAPLAWLELGFQFPLVVLQQGDDLRAQGFAAPQSFAVGTPWLQARFAPLRQRDGAPVDFAVHLGVGLPVGSAAAFTRDDVLPFNPRLGLGRAFGWLRVGVDVGAQLRNGFTNVVLSPQSSTTRDELGSRFEGNLVLSTAELKVRPELGVKLAVPFTRTSLSTELLAGVRVPVARVVEFYALGALGFGAMPGTPTFRALVGFAVGGVDPQACPKGVLGRAGCDDDLDAINNEVDACPQEPGTLELNGCPVRDRDGDGTPDGEDNCPDQPGPKERRGCPIADRDGDGIEDRLDACPKVPGVPERKGCPIIDTDGDGLEDNVDACPKEPGPKERSGCPIKDTDGDGVADNVDNCPTEPGPPENQGCAQKQLVIITSEKLVIKERVFFETGKSKILARSFPLLQQVAAVLKAHPEVGKVEVQGHTDSVGPRAVNVKLSQSRASAVMDYLLFQGVENERLLAKGYGPDKPIEENSTEAGRASNRRVEFIILGLER